MENSLLTAENILCRLRQNRSNKKDLELVTLLENIEKHGFENKSQRNRILEEILQHITGVQKRTSADDGIVFGCVVWLTYLQEQQKLPSFSESQFATLLQWLLDQHQFFEHDVDIVSRILISLGSIFVVHPIYGDKYFVVTLNILLKYISSSTISSILLINALQCLDKILSTVKDIKLSEDQSTVSMEAGQRLLQLHYNDTKPNVESINVSLVIFLTLQVLQKIVVVNLNFAQLEIAALLGLSKTYYHFGIDGTETTLLKPQKVFMSQQALSDSADEIETVINSGNARNCGGKTPKTRKPRAVVKNTRSNENKALNRSPENKSSILVFDIKISDSDASEPENSSNRVLFERSRKAKIRLASISLVGVISRLVDRKIMFGYWHVFFPSGTGMLV